MSALTPANRPRELLIALDRSGDASLRRQLETNLRSSIRSGLLKSGRCLPSTRALADQLGVSRGVVVDAYDQLAAEGLLSMRERQPPVVVTPLSGIRCSSEPASSPMRDDLTPGIPDLASFPRVEWGKALAEVVRTLPVTAFGYPQVAGELALREELAEYLSRTRGVFGNSEDVTVAQGYTQALRLVCEALRSRGVRRICVEDPSFDHQWDIVRSAGLEICPVAVDSDGICVDALARTGVPAVIVTPAHQFPTGVVMASARRVALIAWARATGATIIEDDYDAEFRYDRRPVSALQGAAPDVVAYIGTASKILAPALRLAWLVAPPDLTALIHSAKASMDAGSPTLDQHALAAMLARGLIDRHVRDARNRYRRRRDAFLEELTRALPEASVSGVSAGLFITVTFTEPIDERALISTAAGMGLKLMPLGAFRLTDEGPPGLVLGYGAVSSGSSTRVAAQLRAAVDHARASTTVRARRRQV
jgi:GntR family transcriptional regulator/MocR family aminotransferase